MKMGSPFVFLMLGLALTGWVGACAPVPTPLPTLAPSPPAEAILADTPHTVPEVEQLAGFDVLEPAYLPAGVSLDFASLEETPFRAAVLHFKFFHEQYGDMGPFFQIYQEPQAQAPLSSLACAENAEGCEVLQLGDVPVVYYLSTAGEGQYTESLEWYADGFAFRLHRMAGEPNKIYREELLNVAGSMQ